MVDYLATGTSMRHAHLAAPCGLGLLLGLSGCQEFDIDDVKEDPPEDLDTDVAAPVLLPDIAVEPASLDFDHLPRDCPADPQVITVRNVGDAMLDVTDIALRGQGLEVFAISGRLRAIPPGGQLEVTVDFTPADWVTYDRVRVVVESNDPDEPTTEVPLLGVGAEDAIFEEVYAQQDAGAVDVLFVVDNSGSMSGELNALAGAFSTFISSFINLGLDYHIGVVTTDMDSASQSGRLVGAFIDENTPNATGVFTQQAAQGAAGSGDERGMDAAKAALTAPLIQSENAGFLRTDANLAIVVVSDEDDSSTIRANAFATWLEALKPDPAMTSFSGMVGPDGGGLIPTPACPLFSGDSDADHAPRYHDAIALTGGVWANICNMQAQVNTFLTFLSYVAAGLQYEFPLSHTPTSVGEITVEVDGVVLPYGPPNGWTYNPTTRLVTLLGNGVPGPGAGIRISYPYQTTCD